MFKSLASRFNAIRTAIMKNRLVPILAVVILQTGGCWLCGAPASTVYGVDCSAVKITNVSGLPYGPVSVSWTTTAYDTNYTIYVASMPANAQGEILGQANVDAPANSTNVILDVALAAKANAQGAKYLVNIYTYNGTTQLCYAELQVNPAPQQKKKAPPSPSATPIPNNPQPQQPPAPTAMPTAIPTCRADQTGTPPNCIDIPR
jgi:hypothetical protein